MDDDQRREKRPRLDDGSADPADKDQPAQSRSSRACLNCRKHKMKCENANNPPCKRCAATGKSCIFQQRANAAWGPENSAWTETVEIRLHELEAEVKRLKALARTSGISKDSGEERPQAYARAEPQASATPAPDRDLRPRRSLADSMTGDVLMERQASPSSSEASFASQPLQSHAPPGHATAPGGTASMIMAVAAARRTMPGLAHTASSDAFNEDVLEELWGYFDTLLRLEYHQCPQEIKNNASSPLLLFSILHSAAWFHPSDRLAKLAPIYAAHLSTLVANLTALNDTYEVRSGQARPLIGRGAFEEIVGMLLTCQTTKFRFRNIGAWIAITVRLLLNSYGKVSREAVSDAEWRNLWSWLHLSESKRCFTLLRPSIVDEHPPTPPFLPLPTQPISQPHEQRMRINMRHMARFTGRGLLGPVEQFWSFGATDHDVAVVEPLSEEDFAVKRQWLSELAEWAEKQAYADELIGYHLNIVHVYSIGHGALNYADEMECIEWSRKTVALLDEHAWPRLREAQASIVAFAGMKILGSVKDDPHGQTRDADIRLVEDAIRHLSRSSGERRCTSDYLAMATRLQSKLDRLRNRLGLALAHSASDQPFATSSVRTPVNDGGAGVGFVGGHPLNPTLTATPANLTPGGALSFAADMWTAHSTPGVAVDDSVAAYAPPSNAFAGASPYTSWRPMQPDLLDHGVVQSHSAPVSMQPLIQNGQESWPPAFLSWLGK